MKVRNTPLPYEIAYLLDGGVEYGELSAAAHVTASLYGEIDVLDRILNDNRPNLPRGHSDRQQRRLELETYAARLRARCTPERAATLTVMGMLSLLHAARDYADFLAEARYTDLTVGGALEPFRDVVMLDRAGNPTPRTARRLFSPCAIRHYVKKREDPVHLRNLYRVLVVHSRPSVLRCDFDYEGERAAIEADLNAQARREQGLTPPPGPDFKVTLKPEWRRRNRHRRIKRAAAIASAIVGTAAVSQFARGQEVTITGNEVAFSLTRSARLDSLGGHGSVRVAVRSIEGERLASLCVYQENTPPLDVLASFGLFVAAGEEKVILETGNLYAFEPAAATHPAICERVKARDRSDYCAVAPWRSHRFQLAIADYVAKTRPIYREAVESRVFGTVGWRILRNMKLETETA